MTKPFIRYIGGKNWYLNKYNTGLPSAINNYYEPFLGSGSIYFYLKHNNRIKKKSYVSDINNDLIITFQQIQSNASEIIKELKYLENNRDTFYKVRASKAESDKDKAVRYLYLNRTGFGGIYRVNQRGEYNVPYGNRQYKEFVDEANLKKCAELLSKNTLINSCCFTQQNFDVQKNDFFCLDPPYLGANTPFNRYNEKKFGCEETEQLISLLERINLAEAKYILFVGDNKNFIERTSHLGKIQVLTRSNNLAFAKKNTSMIETIITNY